MCHYGLGGMLAVRKAFGYRAGHMRTMKQDFQLELLNYSDLFKKETNTGFQEKWNQNLTSQEM